MAMTFTIASAAREALSGVIASRLKKEDEEEERRAREYEEVCLLMVEKGNGRLMGMTIG